MLFQFIALARYLENRGVRKHATTISTIGCQFKTKYRTQELFKKYRLQTLLTEIVTTAGADGATSARLISDKVIQRKEQDLVVNTSKLCYNIATGE